jgi:hypothetical protein
MQLTVDVPEALVADLQTRREDLPRILSLGLRELDAGKATGFSGLADVIEFLASLPSPDEVLALRPSASLQACIDDLCERGKTVGLSHEEAQQWRDYQYVEHLVRKAKIHAARHRQST